MTVGQHTGIHHGDGAVISGAGRLHWFFFLPPILFALHNLEEALSMYHWLEVAPYAPPFNADQFSLGVFLLTLVGFCLYAFRWIGRGEYFGDVMMAFVCMEFLNAFVPHIFASVALFRYTPGLITSAILYVPAGLYLLIGSRRGTMPDLQWKHWILGAVIGALGALVCLWAGIQIDTLLNVNYSV